MPYPLGHTAILLRIFKSNAHMSCNLLEFEGFKPNFGILSSRTYVRVATSTCDQLKTNLRPFKPHVCTSCNTGRGVEPRHFTLSSRTYVRVATAKSNKTCSSCTDYYVHLNLFECFTSIDIQCLTVTFSISGWESTLNAVRTSALHQLFGIVRF